MPTAPAHPDGTLYVDLDGTLIRTDLLIETCLALLQRNIGYLLLLPFWLLRGKAWLKHQIARRVQLSVERLPYDQRLLRFLQEQRRSGRKLVLISASDQILVDAVAAHVALFDAAMGSTPERNLSGHHKQQAIQEREGGRPFTYAANHDVDWPVWQQSARIIAVNAGDRLLQRLNTTGRLQHHFPRESRMSRELMRAMRPDRWLRNLLLLLPVLLTEVFQTVPILTQVIAGMICFSLCTASACLLDDLFNLELDRAHERRRHRPLASGSLAPVTGLVAVPLLLIAALAIALLWLPGFFTIVLCLYYALSVFYSLVLKRVMLVNILTLAMLDTSRVIAGAAAIPALPSLHLVTVSLLVFTVLNAVLRWNAARRTSPEAP